jgi:hypothetical protein
LIIHDKKVKQAHGRSKCICRTVLVRITALVSTPLLLPLQSY